MQFPRSHLILIGALSFGLCSFVIAKFTDDPQASRFSNETVLSSISTLPDPSLLSRPMTLPSSPAEPADPVAPPATAVAAQDGPRPVAERPQWREIDIKVKPGDSLAIIFKRHKLSPRDVHAVSTSKPLGKRLTSIYPGHQLVLRVDNGGQLMQLEYSPGPLDTLVYERQGDQFASHHVTAKPERSLAYKHGQIDHSLFVASQRAGLSDAMTMRLAQIFQWDVDFVLDIRPGDEFYVLFEELYLKDEFIGYGEILAAEFVNRGHHYRAIQFADADGDRDYFSPEGESMRKAFLRAPVEFSRISSNFNLRRLHPMFKTVRPHRGIDYAAPTGTPILASGDGRVTKASRTTANGNYVVIRHGEQFVTKYLHLSKFGKGIRAGAKVKQGQVIGLVGATGWATAPHLHYEFLVNGVHQNPRTVSLPNAEPIPGDQMPRFREHTAQYSSLLDNYKNQVNVALAR